MKNQKEQQRNTAIELNAGDRFTIPTGCKATIEDNQIIIEEQKEEFKDGDILHSINTHRVVIFESYQDKQKDYFCSYYNNGNADNRSWGTSYFRHATEEEKQAFFDELRSKGLRWNAKTKQMEKIRKRAKWSEEYFYIHNSCEVYKTTEAGLPFDDENYNIGNYYLPSEREQAEQDAKAVKAIFEKRLKI